MDESKKPINIPIKGAALVLFSGDKCAPCESLKPLLAAEVMRRPGIAYLVLTPDADQMPLYRLYGVRMSPTVAFFRDGVEIGRFAGYRNAETLAETLNRWNVS